MNYEDMSDFEVNKAVSDIVHLNLFQLDSNGNGVFVSRSTDKYDFVNIVHSNFDPCNNPSDAWPIIVENRITVSPYDDKTQGWSATFDTSFFVDEDNPLRAAMICFLKMKDAEK